MDVTVTIPEPRTESLSNRERRAGKRAARGWQRHVIRVDRAQTGAYALIGDAPFLEAGERRLPVGAVVALADYDKTVSIAIVAYDGALVQDRDPETGMFVWYDTARATQTLCDAVEAAQARSQRDALTADVARRHKRLEAKRAEQERTIAARVAEGQVCDPPRIQPDADLLAAEARLAGLDAWEAAQGLTIDPRAALLTERAALVARLADIDAQLCA